MYPNYATNRLLERFFMIYSQWDWKNQEVSITAPDKEIVYKDTMNIIVPSEPFSNSCYNVSL